VNAEKIEPHAPPLGRYDSDDGTDVHEVRLLNVPLRVLAAGREHHDEVMREFAMLALDEELDKGHVPARMIELVEILGRRYGAAGERPDAEVDAAIERGETTVDLVYHVPAHIAQAAEQLEELMAEADEFCRQRQMLALERPPVVRQFADWYLDEFRRQVAGQAPRPWDGPLDV
jgi:hypothetical protein